MSNNGIPEEETLEETRARMSEITNMLVALEKMLTDMQENVEKQVQVHRGVCATIQSIMDGLNKRMNELAQ